MNQIPHRLETRWRSDRPKDRAVVAFDSTGHLLSILEYIGPSLDWLSTFEPLAQGFKRFAEDLPPGPGIWMWEGNLVTRPPDDQVLLGTYRPLTAEEARQSMEGDVPWDPNLWMEEEPLTASLPPSEPIHSLPRLEEEMTLLTMEEIPPNASPQLLQDQIQARRFWIEHRLVGDLYKNMMTAEIQELTEKIPTKA